MSESTENSVPADVPQAAGTASAGALLRAAREAQGLSLDALATQLKVAPRKLDALEADRHEELQGPTFVRALAQAACRALKVDPTPVLLRLPRVEQPTLAHVSRGLNAPFRERGMLRESSEGWFAHRGFLALIVALALVAGALVWLPGGWLSWKATVASVPSAAGAASAEVLANEGVPLGAVPPVLMSPASDAAATSQPGASVPAVPAPASAVVAERSGPASEEAASAAQARPAERASSGSAVGSVATAAASGPAPAPAVAARLVAPAAVLQVRALSQSWIEVVDGGGKLLLGRTVPAGEALALEGALPLRVRVGNVQGTELKFRGQMIDLATVAKDNIARLELK